MLAHCHATFQSTVTAVTTFIARMRDANVRTLEEIAPYLFMAAISPSYGIAINALLTDKPHLMNTPDWTLEMAIRYFAMKHASKPRDYSSNKQDSSSKPQDAHSKYGKQFDRQPDRQPDRQHEKQHDRQSSKSKCPDCGKSHPGVCHTNTSNSLNPISKSSNPPSNKQFTKVTELVTSEIAGKSFFVKGAAESSQHTWHIDSGANYITTSNKAWFISYEARENEYIQIGNNKL
jgi:hypothetical protein